MKITLFICMLFSMVNNPELNHLKLRSNNENVTKHEMRIDSAAIVNALYKKVKIIPSINGNGFNYKYTYEPKSKAISITCVKKIDDSSIEYHIELKDTKSVFNKVNFSVGDDYKYITSYFILDGIKLSLDRTHALNDESNFLTQISNIWNNDKSSSTIKLYKFRKRKIFLIKGVNPFCNGRSCTDYVVYILQKEDNKGSINAVHFEGTNYPYDFNNIKLFYGSGVDNPAILIPNSDRPIKSKLDVDTYKIYFEGIKK